MSKRSRGVILIGMIVLALAAIALFTSDFNQLKTVNRIVVSEASTDYWDSGIPMTAKAGDIVKIDVDSTGGNVSLRVESSDRGLLLNVQGGHLECEVPIAVLNVWYGKYVYDDHVNVSISTRSLSNPSQFVALQGAIEQQRPVFDFFPIGYWVIGMVVVGLIFLVVGFVLHKEDAI